jgi:hypothetical protein
MMDEANQFAQRRLPAQVNNSVQSRMMMASLPDLDELDLATKVINYGLITLRSPPLDRYIVLASRGNDPERDFCARYLPDLRMPGALLLGEMNVPFERSRLYCQAKAAIQKINKAVNAMIGPFIGLIDERIRAINDPHSRLVIVYGR